MNDQQLTWVQVMPVYIESLETGNKEQKKLAKEELLRLAALVDESNKTD